MRAPKAVYKVVLLVMFAVFPWRATERAIEHIIKATN
jgi:hypothetical protein